MTSKLSACDYTCKVETPPESCPLGKGARRDFILLALSPPPSIQIKPLWTKTRPMTVNMLSDGGRLYKIAHFQTSHVNASSSHKRALGSREESAYGECRCERPAERAAIEKRSQEEAARW